MFTIIKTTDYCHTWLCIENEVLGQPMQEYVDMLESDGYDDTEKVVNDLVDRCLTMNVDRYKLYVALVQDNMIEFNAEQVPSYEVGRALTEVLTSMIVKKIKADNELDDLLKKQEDITKELKTVSTEVAEKMYKYLDEHNICTLCGAKYEGYGNNAEPITPGRCCNTCDDIYVVPVRLGMMTPDEAKAAANKTAKENLN